MVVIDAVTKLRGATVVLTELDYLLEKCSGSGAAETVVEHIQRMRALRRYEVTDIAPHLSAAGLLMRRYADHRIGLTDAMNGALAAHVGTDTILTSDRRYYRAVRLLTGDGHHRPMPDDG